MLFSFRSCSIIKFRALFIYHYSKLYIHVCVCVCEDSNCFCKLVLATDKIYLNIFYWFSPVQNFLPSRSFLIVKLRCYFFLHSDKLRFICFFAVFCVFILFLLFVFVLFFSDVSYDKNLNPYFHVFMTQNCKWRMHERSKNFDRWIYAITITIVYVNSELMLQYCQMSKILIYWWSLKECLQIDNNFFLSRLNQVYTLSNIIQHFPIIFKSEGLGSSWCLKWFNVKCPWSWKFFLPTHIYICGSHFRLNLFVTFYLPGEEK